MLTKLRMRNFISFKNNTTIDFSKTNYTLLPNNISEETGVLKSTVFVGGNGAGKSTVLQAIKLFLDMMLRESEINLGQFVCVMGGEQEFELEFSFIIKEKKIRYRLSYDRINRMISEILIENGQLLLKRQGMSAISYFKGEKVVYDQQLIKNDGLFLRTLYFNGLLQYSETLKEWIDFIKNSVYINASVDISELSDLSKTNKYFEENGTDEVNNFLERYNYDQRIEYTNSIKNEHQEWISQEKEFFYHRVGTNYVIPPVNESLGNRNLIRILIDYLRVIKSGGMLIVDEFSSGFHNELEALLIRHFMKEAKNSQMIFVSHSTNLLSNSILRPDQEYSVEFDPLEGSKVNRFSTFQPRNSQNIEKMYNSGVFSGKPVYEDMSNEIQ